MSYNHPLGVWDPNAICWQLPRQADLQSSITAAGSGPGYYWATHNSSCVTTSGTMPVQTSAWAGVFGHPPGTDTVVAKELLSQMTEPEKPKKDPFDPRNWGIAG